MSVKVKHLVKVAVTIVVFGILWICHATTEKYGLAKRTCENGKQTDINDLKVIAFQDAVYGRTFDSGFQGRDLLWAANTDTDNGGISVNITKGTSLLSYLGDSTSDSDADVS